MKNFQFKTSCALKKAQNESSESLLNALEKAIDSSFEQLEAILNTDPLEEIDLLKYIDQLQYELHCHRQGVGHFCHL